MVFVVGLFGVLVVDVVVVLDVVCGIVDVNFVVFLMEWGFIFEVMVGN